MYASDRTRRVLPFLLFFVGPFVGSGWAHTPGTVFRDCPDCPEMVVIPAGNFVMGSPETEAGRNIDEGPQRTVRLAYSFAVGRFEVTRGQFAAFVKGTGYVAPPGNCWYWDYREGKAKNHDPAKDWRNPGFAYRDDHPVICVSWEDAKAYAAWISRKTGKNYRLLSESEWEYAARAGSATARPWGDNPHAGCAHANSGDLTRNRSIVLGPNLKWTDLHNCDDGYAYTAPVGRFQANRFGLYDMIGNVWEWVEDCSNESYAGAPSDGKAWLKGDCARRVQRGGGWFNDPRHARSAVRFRGTAVSRSSFIGFRLARAL